MLEQDIVISNKLGLHARASAKLVQLVSGFRSTVMISCRGREINAKQRGADIDRAVKRG